MCRIPCEYSFSRVQVLYGLGVGELIAGDLCLCQAATVRVYLHGIRGVVRRGSLPADVGRGGAVNPRRPAKKVVKTMISWVYQPEATYPLGL